jgi:endonuclease-3 related protein
MKVKNPQKQLLEIYDRLFNYYGPQHWWPGDEPFEIIVGAILTQSAAWTNVEKGISNLKKQGALSPAGLRNLSHAELAEMVHPCGYFNAKATKLKAFAQWFYERCDESLDKMFSFETRSLREQLLEVHGIGDETADSILLYAGNRPLFVIDAYTRRIIDRLGLGPGSNNYSDYQRIFMDNLPPDVRLFNEYHALLVAQGKNSCKKRPLCEGCCLRGMCNNKGA